MHNSSQYTHIIIIVISGYAVAQWLGIRLQMLGVTMVTGVSFIAVLEHHFNTVDPGVPCMATDRNYLILNLNIFASNFIGATPYHIKFYRCQWL